MCPQNRVNPAQRKMDFAPSRQTKLVVYFSEYFSLNRLHCTFAAPHHSTGRKATALLGTRQAQKLHRGCKFMGIKSCKKRGNYYKVKDFVTFLEV